MQAGAKGARGRERSREDAGVCAIVTKDGRPATSRRPNHDMHAMRGRVHPVYTVRAAPQRLTARPAFVVGGEGTLPLAHAVRCVGVDAVGSTPRAARRLVR